MQTTNTNTDFEVRSLDAMCVNESRLTHKWYHNIKYMIDHFCKSRDHQLVPHTGNVPPPIFSYVWRNR